MSKEQKNKRAKNGKGIYMHQFNRMKEDNRMKEEEEWRRSREVGTEDECDLICERL